MRLCSSLHRTTTSLNGNCLFFAWTFENESNTAKFLQTLTHVCKGARMGRGGWLGLTEQRTSKAGLHYPSKPTTIVATSTACLSEREQANKTTSYSLHLTLTAGGILTLTSLTSWKTMKMVLTLWMRKAKMI